MIDGLVALCMRSCHDSLIKRVDTLLRCNSATGWTHFLPEKKLDNGMGIER